MGRIFAVPPSPFEVDHAGQILAGLRYQAEHGALPDTPMWRMLEHRHAINPVRFDFYHPNVGRILDGLTLAPPFVTHHHGWVGHMRGPKLAPLVVRPDAPPVVVASVPEPPTLGLWLVGLAAVLWLIGRRP
jgi:hypothetical protein